MDLPSSFNNLAFSNDGNTLTAYADDHTSQMPHYMIITRKRSDYNAGTKTFSVPTYRIRAFKGATDAEGYPVPEKTLVDLDIRFPVTGAEGDLTTVMTDLNGFLGQEDLVAAMKKFELPTCCPETDEE